MIFVRLAGGGRRVALFSNRTRPDLKFNQVQGGRSNDRPLWEGGEESARKPGDRPQSRVPSSPKQLTGPAEQPSVHPVGRLVTEQSLHEIGGLVHPRFRRRFRFRRRSLLWRDHFGPRARLPGLWGGVPVMSGRPMD